MKAEQFAGQEGPGGVVFKITTITARGIRHYSNFPDEDEWLLGPNSKFVVSAPLHQPATPLGSGAHFVVELVEMSQAAVMF